jgi:arylsulfatase A-like enzyme
MNIILIVSDTFRQDYLGCYGNNWIKTPNLDKFARKSAIFDNAYAASFPTVPHRMDLVTGRFTFPYREWEPLPEDETVISEMVGEKDYISMLICDTPHILEDGYNFDRGFTGWEWIRGQETDRFYTDPVEICLPCSLGKLRHIDVLERHLRNVAHRQGEKDCFVAKTMSTAAQWLERNYKQDKFFLWVDTFDPHEPWDPPRYYVDMYDPGYEGDEVIYPIYGNRDYLSDEELKHMRALYAGEVTLVDRWIGFLLGQIERLGLFDNTAVIFTSDHGFYFGEHNLVGKSRITDHIFEYVALYEEMARIPLMVYLPQLKKPSRYSAFVQPPDITGTILELAGIKDKDQVQGKSLLSLIKGNKNKLRNISVTSPSLVHGTWGSPRVTVRKNQWSLIVTPRLPGRPDALKEKIARTKAVDGISREMAGSSLVEMTHELEEELYLLSNDPEQKVNLANKEKEVVKGLRGEFNQFLESLHHC